MNRTKKHPKQEPIPNTHAVKTAELRVARYIVSDIAEDIKALNLKVDFALAALNTAQRGK